VIRTAVAAAAMLLIAACATTSHPARLPESPPVPASFAAPPAPAAPDERTLVVDAALSMLGQPYRYGGAAPGGFDCSGLVFYAAAGAGLRVPRTAAEQLNFGMPVSRSNLLAGDLIFMHLARKELHVAIALDNQRFIHAPSTGGRVRIDSLDTSPYMKGFIGARRIVPAPASALSSPSPNLRTPP
jgi:cell wall-associated NlpC family hydrolase